MKNLETNRKLLANRRNTRRSEHCILNLFLQWQRTQTKPVKFIWHSRLLAQRVKTLQETITFANKRKSLLVIQIQEALWRKLNNLKPYLAATNSVSFGSEGQSCRPETKPTENQCVSWPRNVKQAAKITFVKSKLRTLQSIIYPPEGKNVLEHAASF